MGDQAAEFEAIAIQRLRDHGFRITMPRIQVVRALVDSTRALTANEIHKTISESGGRMDIVSVYRTLVTLKEAGLVHHIGAVDGYRACGIGACHTGSTKHAICQSCGKVAELELGKSEQEDVSAGLNTIGFKAKEIIVEVLGFCQACRT